MLTPRTYLYYEALDGAERYELSRVSGLRVRIALNNAVKSGERFVTFVGSGGHTLVFDINRIVLVKEIK